MSHHRPRPYTGAFFTPGTFILLALMAIGYSFGIARFFTGLGAVTNLSTQFPWGIWIAIDVACGVALAAGGFTTAALVDIFGGKKFKPLLRPAVLTAWVGYLMVGFGLMFDLGRYWNIWRPAFNWQGNSVMFELAMCVMAYTTVLSVEMAPSLLEGLRDWMDSDRFGASILKLLEKPIVFLHMLVKTILPLFIIAGVVLSCMHQSSLGTLMVIAPMKLSPLWYTPLLPLLFLMSAIMVGFPMVILEASLSSRILHREPETDILAKLSAFIPWFVGIYSIFKVGDLLMRWGELDFLKFPSNTISLAIEIIIGLFLPFVMLLFKPVRRSRVWLPTASFLVIFGMILNRLNVFLIGYHIRFAQGSYIPSIGEVMITVGLFSTIVFLYKFFITFFPILPEDPASIRLEEERRKAILDDPVHPILAWTFRGFGAAFLLGFIVVYFVVHEQAIADSAATYGETLTSVATYSIPKEETTIDHWGRPEKYRTMYILNSATLNAKTNNFESVRFSHRTHDNFVGGDCSVCHHRISWDEEDRVGVNLSDFHMEMDIWIGGACTNCHDVMADKEIQKCR